LKVFIDLERQLKYNLFAGLYWK